MKPPAQPPPPGYLESLRSLGEGLLATVQERVELFALELEEEKLRLIQMLAWFSVIFCTGLMAIVFISLTLVVLFWDSGRLAILGGLAIFYVLALLAAIMAFKRYLKRQPASFIGTRSELEEDRAWIRNER